MGAAGGSFDGEPEAKDIAALIKVLDGDASLGGDAEGDAGDDANEDNAQLEGDEGEEAEEPKPKPKAPPAKQDEGEEEGAEEEGAEPAAAIETVAQLAQVFGTQPDEILSTLRVDLGGQQGEVPLQTLVDAYRNPTDLAPIQDVVTRYEALTNETATRSRAIFQETLAHAQALKALIAVDESEIEAAKRDGDAGRALELITLNQRRQAALGEAVDAMRKQEAFFGEQRDKDDKTYQDREFQLLLRKMPRWRDEATGRAAMEQIQSSALAMGFTQAEVQQLADHRAILLAWKASEYDRLVAKVKGTAKKKVLALPKHLPRVSSAIPTPRESAQKANKAKMARLRRSGDERDAAALIEGMLD